MKKLLVLAIAFFSIQLASAQETSQSYTEDNTAYTSVEVKPEYPGGMDRCREFIATNFRMPEEKIGKLLVLFVIEKDGSLTDVKAAGDVRFGAGEEAVRVVKSMEKWKPGSQNSKIVRVKYVLPIYVPSSNNKNPKP